MDKNNWLFEAGWPSSAPKVPGPTFATQMRGPNPTFFTAPRHRSPFTITARAPSDDDGVQISVQLTGRRLHPRRQRAAELQRIRRGASLC